MAKSDDPYEVVYHEESNSLYVRLRRGTVARQDPDPDARVYLDVGEGGYLLGVQVYLEGGDTEPGDTDT